MSQAMESEGYRIAKTNLAEIQARFDALLDACDAYRAQLEAEIEKAEREATMPDQYAKRLRMHLTSNDELIQVLETFTHDALVRASDRISLIQVAAEGKFV